MICKKIKLLLGLIFYLYFKNKDIVILNLQQFLEITHVTKILGQAIERVNNQFSLYIY